MVPFQEPLGDIGGNRNGHFGGLMEEYEGKKRTSESAKYLRSRRIGGYQSEHQMIRGDDHLILGDASIDFQRSIKV